jgi:hypothetical protein
LTWTNEAELGIGKKITYLFKRKLGLHITTTAIRSIVETESHHFYNQGKISKSDCEAISNINGHSSRTTESYYLQIDRDADVYNARKMFRSLEQELGIEELGPVPDIFEKKNQSSWIPVQISIPNWGTSHPDYQKRPKMVRAKWTEKEIEYIGNWCTNQLEENYGSRSNIISLLWKHLTKGLVDAQVISIFHEIHVLDSSRLRTGFRIAEKRFPALQI